MALIKIWRRLTRITNNEIELIRLNLFQFVQTVMQLL